jgi:hypothetical protein
LLISAEASQLLIIPYKEKSMQSHLFPLWSWPFHSIRHTSYPRRKDYCYYQW